MEAFTAPKGFGDQTLRDRRADAIELLGGIPDPGVLPTEELTAATARVLARPGVPALQYSRTEGISPLREWIAEREAYAGRLRILEAESGGVDGELLYAWHPDRAGKALKWFVKRLEDPLVAAEQIGRASCRERV